MDRTEILTTLANNRSAYLFDEGGHYVLKNGDGTIIKTTDDYGRDVEARFIYDVIEGLISHHYIEQDKDDARIYRISAAGLRAAQSP